MHRLALWHFNKSYIFATHAGLFASFSCKFRENCFFDISIGGAKAERIVFKLNDDIVPKTAAKYERATIIYYAHLSRIQLVPHFQ